MQRYHTFYRLTNTKIVNKTSAQFYSFVFLNLQSYILPDLIIGFRQNLNISMTDVLNWRLVQGDIVLQFYWTIIDIVFVVLYWLTAFKIFRRWHVSELLYILQDKPDTVLKQLRWARFGGSFFILRYLRSFYTKNSITKNIKARCCVGCAKVEHFFRWRLRMNFDCGNLTNVLIWTFFGFSRKVKTSMLTVFWYIVQSNTKIFFSTDQESRF